MAEKWPTIGVDRVLLSTDGSEFSEGAVREVLRQAQKCSSSLTVLFVIDYNPEFASLAPQIIEEREQEARQYLEVVQPRVRMEGGFLPAVAVHDNTIFHPGFIITLRNQRLAARIRSIGNSEDT